MTPVDSSRLTDDYLRAIRSAWDNDEDYRSGRIPIWVGGNSDAGLRRAVRLGEIWHPLRFTLARLPEALDGCKPPLSATPTSSPTPN